MVKLAQFKNNKIKFTNDSDYPDNQVFINFLIQRKDFIYRKSKKFKKRLSSYFSSNRGDGKRLKKLKSSQLSMLR